MDNVLEHPEVVAAIAKLQGKYDTRITALERERTELSGQLREFTSAVDSLGDDTDDSEKPKNKGAIGALKSKAEALRAKAVDEARQAETRELAKHRSATDLFIKYGHRGVKLQDLLGMSDEVEMREHIITVLDAAATSTDASSRKTGSDSLSNKPNDKKGGDFGEAIKDLLDEGKHEGRVVFQTQRFD